jgi:hypothetical protein
MSSCVCITIDSNRLLKDVQSNFRYPAWLANQLLMHGKTIVVGSIIAAIQAV